MSPRAQKRCTGARRLWTIGMFFGCLSYLTAWSQLRDRIFVHQLQDCVRKRRVAVWIGTVVDRPTCQRWCSPPSHLPTETKAPQQGQHSKLETYRVGAHRSTVLAIIRRQTYSETESAHRRLRLGIPYLMLFSHS